VKTANGTQLLATKRRLTSWTL